jgi:hypothetical protein
MKALFLLLTILISISLFARKPHLNPSRQPYFSQHRENRVFWDLERLFGNIAVKIDLIAK